MTIAFTYPDSPVEILVSAPIFVFLVAITYRSARVRALPPYFAACGLLFLTGTVYVVTLHRRGEDAPAFRDALAKRLARYSTLLAILTFFMTIYLLVGSALFLMTLLSLVVPVKIYMNGREVESFLEVIPGLVIALYFVGLGVFHFALTRRRVQSALAPLRRRRTRSGT